MKIVKEHSRVPEGSIILKGLKGSADYMDSYSTEIYSGENYSIDYITALVFSLTSFWVEFLSSLRDIIVKPFGLKTGLVAEKREILKSVYYNIGDRAVLFNVTDRTESEIVMGEDDSHLYFRTSVMVHRNTGDNVDTVYLTTIVQFHNIIGKLYFFPVKPFHKVIVKYTLKKLKNSLQRV